MRARSRLAKRKPRLLALVPRLAGPPSSQARLDRWGRPDAGQSLDPTLPVACRKNPTGAVGWRARSDDAPPRFLAPPGPTARVSPASVHVPAQRASRDPVLPGA